EPARPGGPRRGEARGTSRLHRRLPRRHADRRGPLVRRGRRQRRGYPQSARSRVDAKAEGDGSAGHPPAGPRAPGLRRAPSGADPAFRTPAEVRPAEPMAYDIATSGEHEGSYRFTRFAVARFELASGRLELELYWLEGYGGGLFLPFRDRTSGKETYGAGRYL